MLCVLVPLLLALAARAEPWSEPPYDVVSTDGTWRLHVVATDPDGAGPMRCQLLHGGEETWSGEFPWLFQEAGVANDGTIVGYANLDTLRIAIVDAHGKLRKQHDIPHTVQIVDGGGLPVADGPVLVHGAADLALIRVLPADQSRPAPWRAFRLSTGDSAPDVLPETPAKLTEQERVSERDARVVGDTQLMITHWAYTNLRPERLGGTQLGGIFALHDLRGRVVWRSLLPDDYGSLSSGTAFVAAPHDGPFIVSAGPGPRFTLRHVKENETVEYSVEKDASGGWSVKEVARAPWVDARRTPIPTERIELDRLGLMTLHTTSRPPTDTARHPTLGLVDVLGRVLLQDIDSQAVYVFDSAGQALGVCALAPDERDDKAYFTTFRGLRDGSIALVARGVVARFDVHGARLASATPSAEALNRHPSHRYGPAVLDSIDPDAAVTALAKLRPDGRRLYDARRRARLPDGRAVVLQEPSYATDPVELHVYSPSGEPLRTVKLPGRPSWSQLSASDRWIVVGDVRPPWILVRVADLSLFTFEPKLEPKIEPETSWIAGQTQDGKVLLLLDPERKQLVRFALP